MKFRSTRVWRNFWKNEYTVSLFYIVSEIAETKKEVKMINDNLEVIDFERKGNLVRLYLGENGEQWGDDWNDAPYQSNAGKVYDKFVQHYFDIVFPFDCDIIETESFNVSKQNMMNREVAAFKIAKEGGIKALIYFGDTLKDITQIPEVRKAVVIYQSYQ